MRKLAIVISSLQPGGAEKATVVLARELTAKGINVAICTVKRTTVSVAIGDYASHVPFEVAGLAGALRQLRALVAFFRCWQPDCVIGTSWAGIVVAYLANRLSSRLRPLVTVEHNLPDWYARKVKLGWLKRGLVCQVHRAAHAVIVPSRIVRDQLVQRGVRPEKVHVIPNPVEIPPRVEELVMEPLRIVTVARLYGFKRVDAVIRTVEVLGREHGREALLEIAGNGPKRGELEGLVRKLRLEQSIRFLGWVSETGEILRRAAVLVHLSEVESFGNVVCEALAYGRAAVIARWLLGSLPFLRPDEDVLVSDGSPEGTAEVIERALRSGRLREVARAGRMAIQREAAAAVVADRYVGILARSL